MTDLVVLCYHAVSGDWPSDLAVMPERMERQLARLVDRGYRGATFTAAVTTPPVEPTVVVTFDDAFRSVAKLAAPILARLGLPGTVFVPTAYVGSEQPMAWSGIEEWRHGPWAEELLPMTLTDLRALADAGWEIGSHTHTHPRLTHLDDAALKREMERSRTICEEIRGSLCLSVAYPYGDYDARVMRAAAAAGYRAGGTLPDRLHDPRPLSWPRIYVWRYDGDRRFQLKVTPAIRWLRSTALWRAVQLIRDLSGKIAKRPQES